MVNTDPCRLIQYQLPPDPYPYGTRVKIRGPRYRLDMIQQLADPERIRAITDRCISDLARLNWTNDDVSDFISLLEARHYHDSEWCESSVRMLVDCDAYHIKLNLHSFEEDNAYGSSMYVKFGRRPNNEFVLILSCHD